MDNTGLLYIIGSLTDRIDKLEEHYEANNKKIMDLAESLRAALECMEGLSEIVGENQQQIITNMQENA